MANLNLTGIPDRNGLVEADDNHQRAEAEIKRLNLASAEAAVVDAERALAEAKAAS